MRKLRRIPNKLEESIKEPVKKKTIILYKKKRCTHLYANGSRCVTLCVGRGNVCREHGGTSAQESLIETTDKDASLFIKYDPAYHPIMYVQLSNEGLSDVEIAATFKVGIPMIRKWADKYMEFSKAFEIGQSMYEAWWLREGRRNLDSRFYQTGLYKFITGNKLGYSDKVETKNLNQSNFGVLLIPPEMSMDEWEKNNMKEDAIDI